MHVDKTRFERRYSISVETKRPLVDVSDQSTVKQLRRNYGAIENAFNTGSPKLVRARPDRRPRRVGRRTHAVFVPCGVPWTDRIHCTTYVHHHLRFTRLAGACWSARARVATTQREMHLPVEGDAIFSGAAFVQSATRFPLSLLLSTGLYIENRVYDTRVHTPHAPFSHGTVWFLQSSPYAFVRETPVYVETFLL